jgi:hypothetical protein
MNDALHKGGSDIHRAAHSLIARGIFPNFPELQKAKIFEGLWGVSEPTFSANYKDVIYTDTKQEVEATRNARSLNCRYGRLSAA